MQRILSLIIIVWFSIFAVACATKKDAEKTKYNTVVNKKYIGSKRTVTGQLNSKEYESAKKRLENELKIIIPIGKSILVNFDHDAVNCILYNRSTNTTKNVIANISSISNRISNLHNTVDYFVYTDNSLFKEYYPVNHRYIKDSGFFENELFRENENCMGFYILKASGEYMKYFGSDYFSEVEKFLESGN